MRSPMGQLVNRRQKRYLRDLAKAYEAKDYERALSGSIRAGGGAGGFLSLRLPRPSGRVTGPSRTAPGIGNTAWSGSVQQFLMQHYRRAAEDLERDGRLDEAAFVLADLMGNVYGAVMLYERHARYREAAELAVARQLQAELQVRLLWLAGDRRQALDIARSRGAFANALDRVAAVDVESAHDLRRAWVDLLRLSGAHLAAVEVAWPDERLRREALPDIEAGESLGGWAGGRLLAHRLALVPDDAAASRARALLQMRERNRQDRIGLLEGLAENRCGEATLDRELASAALRAVVDPRSAHRWPDHQLRKIHLALRDRADPVLRADTPSSGWKRARRSDSERLEVRAPASGGLVPVRDVAALPDGSALVASGEHGLRLVGRDGRARASWRTVTDRIILADHGGSALLAQALGDNVWQLHELTFADRRIRAGHLLRAYRLPDSTDGRSLMTWGAEGRLDFLDVWSTGRPRVMWTEGGMREQVLAVTRDASSMAALVNTYPEMGQPGQELWVWRLPDLMLTTRRRITLDEDAVSFALTSTGRIATVHADEYGSTVHQLDERQQRIARPIDGGDPPGLLASGPAYAVVSDRAEETHVEVTRADPRRPDATVAFDAGAVVCLRSQTWCTLLWDTAGRIVVLDLVDRRTLAAFSVRID